MVTSYDSLQARFEEIVIIENYQDIYYHDNYKINWNTKKKRFSKKEYKHTSAPNSHYNVLWIALTEVRHNNFHGRCEVREHNLFIDCMLSSKVNNNLIDVE